MTTRDGRRAIKREKFEEFVRHQRDTDAYCEVDERPCYNFIFYTRNDCQACARRYVYGKKSG